MSYEAVVIGASAGGLDALKTIFSALPADFPLPVIVVLHLHRDTKEELINFLNVGTRLKVKYAEDKEKIKNCTIYIAPPDYHLLIEDDKTLSLSVDALVNYSRPSIDVLFECAADVFREHCFGIILTGANSDGSGGLKRIKEKGGMAIVQNPHSAEYSAMPTAAIAVTDVDYILDIEEIAGKIMELVRMSVYAKHINS
ncbi:chemotaxis protein CheB [Candidatus Magnetomonas plexicatena]|uniref:chemotaxis protein CheB n=1 Tax=Candidatus Magnetomonas plexicatena TaxID=2552947 RepID=UPI001C7576BB|nr:chemotaxis protein CheB [Nitrospirales bacterium LBB_01]